MNSRTFGFFCFIIFSAIAITSFYLNATPKDTGSAVPAHQGASSSLQQDSSSPSVDSKMFDSILARIKEDYVEEVTDDKLLAGALNGMLSSLDPHSAYLDPKSYKELTEQTKGEYGGLGMEVTMENGLVKIISPIDDTPAKKAGLEAGDLIVAIDKKPISGMTLLEAVDLLRGKPGSSVRLHIKREGKDVFEKTLTRAIIQVKAVKWRVEGDIGYIRIATFNDEKTVSLVKEAIAALKKQLGDKLGGLILDVRNDPGGLLDAAIGVSNLFLAKGQEIVSTKGRNPQIDSRIVADASDITGGLPIVVLINGGSASASEILAGALQDNHRAIVAGTKSFGKGSVQVVLPLTNGGALKLTTARYYTPSGRSIQAKGIEPDIVIDQVQTKLEKIDEKERIREEDFAGALDTANESKSENKTPEAVNDNLDPDKKKKQEVEDYQLMRALDIIRTMAITKKYDCQKGS
ncbi:MAG: S41 family peptidase [Proteobacteria bacterium]|nr:S41 family peptidase [Pseudomonadota bacterium]